MIPPQSPCRHDHILCTRDTPCRDCIEDAEIATARLNAHLWTCTRHDCWQCQYARTVGADLPKPADL